MTPTVGIPKCYKFENYKNAITKYGGKVKCLSRYEQTTEKIIDSIQGLLLPGGDIDPDYYGEEQHLKTQHVDEERDAFDISHFREGINKR